MRKHVHFAIVLACTLSTQAEGIERTLPCQVSPTGLSKKSPGIF
ncbi:MAG TPA: hypothetical protein VKV20_14640 [Ktedonobacteraceae bacterium]|nr:hypothetical protein [Ktedonobacteraceae bacterium]